MTFFSISVALCNNIPDRFDLLFDFLTDFLYLKPDENFSEPYEFDRMGFIFVEKSKTVGDG